LSGKISPDSGAHCPMLSTRHPCKSYRYKAPLLARDMHHTKAMNNLPGITPFAKLSMGAMVSRFKQCAAETLDEAVFATSVSQWLGRVVLEIRDTTSAEGWRVGMTFSPNAPSDEIRARMRTAVALRTWRTAPPVVAMAS
jgi:hypothetical protein